MSNLLTLFGNRPSLASLIIPAGALAVYSVVKTPSWAGACVRIERASDSTQLDIGFTSSGYMDTVAALAFAAGSVIRIATWYDQSGNGYDATATTGWPTIISGNTIGGVQPITFIASTGFSNLKLNIPAGLTVSTQSFTACMAFGGGGGLANHNGLFSLGTQVNIWWEKYAGVLQSNSAATFAGGDKKKFTPRQAQVDSMILSGDAAGKYMRHNGNDQSVAAYTAANPAGATIGTGSVVTTTALEIFAFVVYGTAISAGDKTIVDNGFKTAFKAFTPFTSKIFYDGDSITAGFTVGAYGYGWPRVVSTVNGQNAAVYNVAVPGSSMNTCNINRAQITGRYDSAYAKNVSVIHAGTNDIDNRASGTIVGWGTTVWTTYTLPYIQAMIAAGFTRVIVGTAIARTFAGSAQDKLDKEAERLVYNQLIRDNAAPENFTVLDFAGLAGMSVSTNLTYFVDGVHPTRVGYNVMGTYAAPIIAAYT